MKKILLIGGGGHCKAAIDVIESDGRFTIEGIIRPAAEGLTPLLKYPIVGGDDELPELLKRTPFAMITVGQIKSSAPRQRIYESLKFLGAELPTIVSSRGYVSKHALLSEGILVMHGAVVQASARIGFNTIINDLALVEHDATIGNHCHVSTGARVNGGVIIEEGCFIGSGAIIHENVRIGAGSVIGAGCVIGRDVEPKSMMKGPGT